MKHQMYTPNFINKIRTLLNGETLLKFKVFRCSASFQKICTSELDIMEKGLNSLENPVLRGSFTLVLNEEKLNFLDNVAKQGFTEIMSKERSKISISSSLLPTIHLQTDPGKIQNKRPGVYVIQHTETGKCIVGQTKDLRKRFNQYTSRSKALCLTTTNKINKNFYKAVQKMPADLDYSQIFQRYVVYTWVDNQGTALDIENSLQLKNEMNYLEHRLILAFFEAGLSYNFENVGPILVENKILLEDNPNKDQLLPRVSRQTGYQPKPFKIENHYFYSSTHYERFPQVSGNNTGKFLSMPTLRKKLRKTTSDLNSDVRYLTNQEIEQALNEDLFYKPN